MDEVEEQKLWDDIEWFCKKLRENRERIKNLESEKRLMCDALAFYAEQKHLNIKSHGCLFNFGVPGRIAPPYLLDAEHGYVASEALNKVREP